MNTKSSIISIAPSSVALAFTILKLCGVINWSWWWVLSPIWIWLGLSLLVLGIWLLCVFIVKRLF